MSGREPDRREPRREADGFRAVLREELGDMMAQQGRPPAPIMNSLPPPPPGYPSVAGAPLQYPAAANLATQLPPAPQLAQQQRRFCYNCSKYGFFSEDHLAPQCPRPRLTAASRLTSSSAQNSPAVSPAAAAPVIEDPELQAKITALTVWQYSREFQLLGYSSRFIKDCLAYMSKKQDDYTWSQPL